MAHENWNQEIEDTDCQTPTLPVLCSNGCGYFGSSVANQNLCSKCSRELLSKHLHHVKASSCTTKRIPETTLISIETSNFSLDKAKENAETLEAIQSSSSSKAAASSEKQDPPSEPERIQAETPSRCSSCRKKIGLTGFKCRCGKVFCYLHRYSDKHTCSFDYKTIGRDAIAKANPIIKADKIDKI